MINLVDIEADHVLGVRVHHNVLASDIELAMNFLKKKIRNQDHIALYAEIDDVSHVEAGIGLAELRHGITQVMDLSHIDRVALVTDNEAIRSSEKVLGLLPNIDVKTFSGAEKESAKSWISQK